ncbi:Na(+)/H(+) antiporter subunit F [Methanimicrococcus sp. At1]|uniref:Na(+)/H(+) antiporter subunit F n=1 Tax=Methanimicrococcus hacksteinii TaxID=3028293 RepID=A0ABU3VQT1_9EURY|nr:monovalent cation/H+ antiporter complex subunit F [Methanimicrococcus sp. At1]MDV0445770.1 Na(+)/H(+) antiporter subunit F [Methanimicrococcus sp. At1]
MIEFGLVTSIALVVATCALFLAVYRLFVGPTIMDRVASLDAIGNTLVVIFAIYAFSQDSQFLIDIAILLALISFIGTLALAKYIDKGEVF